MTGPGHSRTETSVTASGDRIGGAAECRDAAERLTGPDQPHDNLVAFGRELRELHGAGLNDIEGFGGVPLPEEQVAGLHLLGAGSLGHVPHRLRAERCEQCDRLEQIAARVRHAPRISGPAPALSDGPCEP
jgi:hypothetical protein